MNRYIQITIQTANGDESDLLVAKLSQSGFEGFEEEPGMLHAYIPETLYEAGIVEKIIGQIKGFADPFHTLFQIQYIEPRNWNEEWEKDFEPVVVGDFCCVRAHFHAPVPGVKYDLEITPKMSFGTGHHATTFMMISVMKDLNCKNLTVLDFGTGTGVLAILAAKMGAKEILAIDSDDWSIENALENVSVNHAFQVRIEKQDTIENMGRFDFILANINLRVILDNIPFLRQHLTETGVFIGSGVLESDEERVRSRASEAGFIFERLMIRDHWMCFCLKNQTA